MLLKELITQLVYGELSQLPIVDDHDQGELQGGFDAIMPHINLALTAVHKRLYLREESLILRQEVGVTKYFINEKFAVSNDASAAPVKYIIDSIDDPYLGDSLKVETIHNADGDLLVINNSTEDQVIRTPTPNTISIMAPVANTDLTVTYRANHPKIDVLTFDADTQELDIPDFVLEPLLYFIASRVHASYPSITDGSSQSLSYRQKYEASLSELSDHGLVDTSSDSNQKLETNGWS